jgi:hypothetical protein
MRLLRLLLSLAVLLVLAWVVVAVPLGRKTIWEHLRAIAGSKESRELVDEVKQKASRVLRRDAGPARPARRGDELSDKERELLRKLIREKLGEKPGV